MLPIKLILFQIFLDRISVTMVNLIQGYYSNQKGRINLPKKIIINDCELPIMKFLWKKNGATSCEIFADINGNRSTFKTLLSRLVERGAVRVDDINQRSFRYFAVVKDADYIDGQRKSFLQKVFDGSAEKMLLNFVKEENISADALRRLVDLIES